jgi:molecular chaperone GrpE
MRREGFFKKRKTMNEQTFDNEHTNKHQTDNLAQENDDQAEDFLSKEINSDDSIPGSQHPYEEDAAGNDTSKIEAELAEAKDKYLRLVAEFDNFRRRTAKERNELSQTAGRDIIQSLLVVLDDTDRAAKQLEASNDIEQVREGISLVFNKLHATLHNRGLRKMESMHQPFDTDLHEAITEIPAPTPDMVGKVIDVIEPGYYLNDKIIRHAKVIVGK